MDLPDQIERNPDEAVYARMDPPRRWLAYVTGVAISALAAYGLFLGWRTFFPAYADTENYIPDGWGLRILSLMLFSMVSSFLDEAAICVGSYLLRLPSDSCVVFTPTGLTSFVFLRGIKKNQYLLLRALPLVVSLLPLAVCTALAAQPSMLVFFIAAFSTFGGWRLAGKTVILVLAVARAPKGAVVYDHLRGPFWRMDDLQRTTNEVDAPCQA
jgi:hypothetical protein